MGTTAGDEGRVDNWEMSNNYMQILIEHDYNFL